VAEHEVEEVLRRPIEERSRREGSRVALGQSEGGRYLRVIYVPDRTPGLDLRHHSVPARSQRPEGTPTAATETVMKQASYPPGWDDERVRRVLEHYETQSDEESGR
jgi:hypothetical protein